MGVEVGEILPSQLDQRRGEGAWLPRQLGGIAVGLPLVPAGEPAADRGQRKGGQRTEKTDDHHPGEERSLPQAEQIRQTVPANEEESEPE